MVEGVRGAEVYVLPAPDQAGEKDALLRDAIVYLTCLHETGHALGLPHTARFADIMYSFQYGGDISEYFGRYRRQLASRADIRKHSGMSVEDRRKLVELYK
jgi:predicted Zn-dependent protease